MSYLELRNLSKSFGDFSALKDVSVSFDKGSITAVLGENGAGKTTLMNVLYGLYRPSGGQILLDGRPIVLRSPKDAIRHRIGMIHQHFHLAPALTVAENVLIGSDRFAARLRLREHVQAIAKLSDDFGFDIDPDAPVWKLPLGMQQRAEILKALYRKAEVLILDEPTSVLAPDEIKALLRILIRLRDAGTTVLFVTHKLDEVFATADRIAVMRHGELVSCVPAGRTSQAELARQMVGHELPPVPASRGGGVAGDVQLRVTGLAAKNDRGGAALEGVSFELRAGEVLGITGVDGNGQRELAEVIAGLRKQDAGSIELKGVSIGSASIRDRLHKHALSYVPEDRHKTGLVLDHAVWLGFFLRGFYRAPAARWTLLQRRSMRTRAEDLVKGYDCRLRSIDQPIRELSGGNQQKVIIARELEATPSLLVIAQATKGLDIGAIDFVQRKILEQRDRGVAVLYISTELEHVLQVADRVGVMYRGQLSKPVDKRELSMEQLGARMSGAQFGVHA